MITHNASFQEVKPRATELYLLRPLMSKQDAEATIDN